MSEDSEIPESTAFLAFLYDITGSTKQVENEQADKLNLMNGELIADALAILIQGYGIGIPKKDVGIKREIYA
ncbi:MAG: hypothetical protein EZS28_004303 [Streblomastix strix]|uniref:Uncharacterized protein n=1 Tax=Streblomastix strix TaxID=222440 RepID=A0A5J4X117_9EUKA|nr:MAG: hypothetical protein EZS28_004303 [Streblomastix strix]